MKKIPANIRVEGNVIFLPISLVLENAEKVFLDIISYFKKTSKKYESFILEFKELECYDSAIVAIILALLRAAQKKEMPIYFSNIEKGVIDLAELGGVDNLIVQHII
jgi:anti-anti-sigma regulatory factor